MTTPRPEADIQGMHVVFIYFTVTEGKVQDFLRREAMLNEMLQKKKGFVSYCLHKVSGKDLNYIGIQTWRTRADAEESHKDPAFGELIRLIKPLESPPDHVYAEQDM